MGETSTIFVTVLCFQIKSYLLIFIIFIIFIIRADKILHHNVEVVVISLCPQEFRI